MERNNKDEFSNIEKFKPYKSKENCCGCSACYASCPINAIEMRLDEEGFLYPFINENKCIKCYKCVKICSFQKNQNEKGYMTN